MKTLMVVTICVVFVAGPVLADMEGEAIHEVEKHMGRNVENEVGKTIFHEAARQVVEHPEVLAAPPAAHAGHVIAPSAAPSGAATSHLLSSIIVGTAIAGVFIGLLVYDLTHQSGATAFDGSTWETCANAPWTGSLHDTCRRNGFLRR